MVTDCAQQHRRKLKNVWSLDNVNDEASDSKLSSTSKENSMKRTCLPCASSFAQCAFFSLLAPRLSDHMNAVIRSSDAT